MRLDDPAGLSGAAPLPHCHIIPHAAAELRLRLHWSYDDGMDHGSGQREACRAARLARAMSVGPAWPARAGMHAGGSVQRKWNGQGLAARRLALDRGPGSARMRVLPRAASRGQASALMSVTGATMQCEREGGREGRAAAAASASASRQLQA